MEYQSTTLHIDSLDRHIGFDRIGIGEEIAPAVFNHTTTVRSAPARFQILATGSWLGQTARAVDSLTTTAFSSPGKNVRPRKMGKFITLKSEDDGIPVNVR